MAIPSGGLINKYDLLDPACYPGSGTVINDLVGTSDLLVTGSPTYDATLGCLTFNGTGVGAYSLPGAMANITSTFTFSFWFRLNDGSVTQCLINNGERTSAWSGYSLFKDAANAKLDFGANFVWGGYWSSPNLNDTQWYNATYTYENVAGGTLKFYIDGVLISNNTGVGGPANAYGANAYLALGGNATAGFGAPQFQNKTSYAVVLFYNTVLTGPQVLDIYNEYSTRFLNPVHEYDAADPASYPGSGSTLTDIGSSPINLSIQNATFDNVNDSFTLQGNLGSYIRSAQPISIGIGANNFSYQMWFQYNGQSLLTGPTDPQLQVGSRGPGDYGGCTIVTSSGQLGIESPGVGTLFTGFYPTAGNWYLITVTVNSSNLNTLYVDGVSTYSGTQSYGSSGTINSIALGPAITNLGDASLSGFGPVQIFNRVLTTTEITNYYNSTEERFNPPIPTVEYDFSDPACYPGTGSSFFDLSGGSTDGVINGTTFVSDGSASYFTTNGSSTYLSTDSYTPSSSTVFSYHLWCQLNNNTFGSLLKLGGDASTFNTPAINVNDPSAGRLVVSFGFLVSVNNPTETIPTNTWTLVSVVCDGTTNKVYYDGVLVNSISQSTGFFGNGSMLFGRFQSPAQYSSAKFALFNVYNTALSDSEVTTFYNDTVARFFPPPPPAYAGLVGGRTFGQGFAG